MKPLRRLARPLLAATFVTGGIDSLRNPGAKAPAADDLARRLSGQFPQLKETDAEQLVKANAGVQVGAGSLLAIGRFPRLSAFALAASLVPTTAAAHRFWEMDDPTQRAQHRIHFFKNLSLLGGLLIASADTAGQPGLGYRARHRAEHAGAAVKRSGRQTRAAAKIAKRDAKLVAKGAREKLPV